MTIAIDLTRRIYTRDALQQTIEVFADLCKVSFKTEQDSFALQVTAPQPQISDEFLNYALGLSAQELLR